MAKKPEEATVIYKPEEDKLVVTGILTAYRQGTNRFDKENERYFVSVRAKCPVAIRSAIRDKYFSDCKDKYIPDVLKKLDEANDEEEVYFNLKSLYEIPAYHVDKGNQRYSYDDVIELGEGLPPRGSTVECAMRLKEGAIYPLAIRFLTVEKTSVDEYFS